MGLSTATDSWPRSQCVDPGCRPSKKERQEDKAEELDARVTVAITENTMKVKAYYNDELCVSPVAEDQRSEPSADDLAPITVPTM